MGRVSKYSTVEERLKATKEQKKKYSTTPEAKKLRHEQNRRAYQRRTESKSKLSPTWSTIPRALHEQAALPLPQKSHHFVREYRTQEQVSDEDTLAMWDFYPPYQIPHGTVLDVIIDRVHGRRLREQYQQEVERLQRYRKSTDDTILQEISRDIETYLTSWKDLKRILKNYRLSDINYTMGIHLMQWKARRVVDLLQDWRFVKKGRANEAFTCHFAHRW